MKLKRFNSLHEAKEAEGKKEAIDFIKKELEKKKMSGREVKSLLSKKYKDSKLVDDVYHYIFRSSDMTGKLKKEYYVVDGKKHHTYYFLSDDAAEPSGDVKVYGKTEKTSKKEKEDKKEDKKEKSVKKVQKFDEFDEKEAQKAKADAQKDIKEDKKGGKTDRQTNFAKDSLDQLYTKRGNIKYKDQWTEIEDEIAERPKKKGRK
jgi:hypothetical protein